jgi:hypothetical protein
LKFKEYAGMSERGEPDSPLILHCHIPKTAGTTVSAGLRKSFDLFHFHHWHPDPFYILTPEVLGNVLRMIPTLKSITSHHLRSFPLSINGRPTFRITFVRKPEDTFISQLRHVQRRFSSLPGEVRVFLPPNTPQLTLRELAWQYLERVTASQDFCPQTRFLCNTDAAAQFGLSDGNDYGADSYEMAHSILNEFHFVGIVEEMKKSLEVLADRLLQFGVRDYFDLNLRLNVGAASSRPAWLTPEDQVGRRVLDTSRTDQLLHRQYREEILQEHSDLRKRRWLGFGPAATDAREQLTSGLRDTARSVVNSVNLYRNRRTDCGLKPLVPETVCSDRLELRAARTVADRRALLRSDW